MNNITHILYADGLKRGRAFLRRVLSPENGNLALTEVCSLEELRAALNAGACDLVLSELDLPGCVGLDLVDAVQAAQPGLPLVVLTDDTDRALEAMQRGVADCLGKTPRQLARLPHVVRRVLEGQRLEREKRQVEERLRMVTRARTVMAECNRVLIRASDENQLLRDMCRIVVDSGGYRAAWVGLVRHDEARTIEPVAGAGVDVGHLASTAISWGPGAAGQGPSGIAVRNRRPQAARHIQTDPVFTTWRQLVVEHGFEAAAALPLISGDVVLGVLGILAAEPDAFDGGELGLLEELAHDIAYGLSNLRLRATQRRADHLLRLEHSVTRCLAEADSLTASMQAVMREVCETEGWDCGRYFRLDAAAGVVRFEEGWGIDSPGIATFLDRSRRVAYAPGAGLVGKTWESGEPLWVADLITDPRALRAAYTAAAGLRGAFNFPITFEGRAIGVLCFSSREIREPDERLLQTARVIGSQIGQLVQRREAEAVLRESEERFRSLTTLSSDWYWEQDAEYRFVGMTNEIDRRTGISSHSHLGKRRWELPAPNMTEALWAEHRALVEAHQPFHDLELNRIAEDGSSHWVSISGEPMFDGAGVFKGYRGIGKDITERKREEKLLALEHAVTRSLAAAESVEAGLQAAMRVMCETQAWECGRYFHGDDFAGLLRFGAAWHVPGPAYERFVERSRNVTFGHGQGLIGRVWDTGQPLWSPDITSDPRTLRRAHAMDMGVRAQFDVPVTAADRPIGVLVFSSREVREPDDRLLRAVSAIGSQIGQFLQRKEADDKIRRQALRQRLIAEFGKEALANGDIADVLHRATALVSRTLDVELADVLELEPVGEQLVYRAVSGWPEEWVGRRRVPLTPGSRVHHVLTQGEPFLGENFEENDGFNPSRLAAFGVKSGGRVPILGSKGTFGLLGVHSRQQRLYTEDDASFLRSIANILAIAVERKTAEDRLAHLAEFDTVTGLPNRHLFRDRLGQSLTQAQRNDRQVAVLFIDLDRFKIVNDTHGHAVGDILLKQVGTRLGSCVRSGDTVARLAGDEFAIVLSGLAKADDAGLVAQKVVQTLVAPFELEGHQTYISASVGVSVYPVDGDQVDTLLRNADTAMYRAKQQGRNGYQFYLPEMNERLMERLQLEAKLRGALERGEFRLHYQPKIGLDTGAISGFEALLRWQQGDRLVSPADFIPILEDTGLIVPVGEWVVRAVCSQIRDWQTQGISAPRVAVNLSTRQFQHKNLVLMVEGILRETGVAPDLLELELTESLLMSDAEEAAGMLRELKGLGVRLGIDDFGTGYSSLAYLKRFPLDTLKIDRAFIRDIVTDSDDATLTLTIINLAHSMRLKVVAEGVETQAQVDFLRRNGCDEMQGYYFARPMPAGECLRMLIEDREFTENATRSAIRLLRLSAGERKAAA